VFNTTQGMSREYRKAGFKASVKSVPSKYKLRFLLGDIFPSLTWMKSRYKCNGAKALLYYVPRIAKLLWLV
jgi:hypothetical protein